MTNPNVTITPTNSSAAAWRGCVEWTVEDGFWRPWRLPADRVATAHSPKLTAWARMAAGIRAVVRTDAERVTVGLHVAGVDDAPLAVDDAHLDIVVDETLWSREAVGGTTSTTVALPPGVKTVEVWLPQFGECALRSLEFGDVGSIEPIRRVDQPRWVTYGSSITQCRQAAGPSETWPALVARRHGWDLTCLGFGGQCHLDPVVARTIAGLPADIISLCLGINVYSSSSYSWRTWPSHVSGFVEAVRDAHPTTPIAVITPIAAPEREAEINRVGLTLDDIRRGVVDATQLLQRLGDEQLHLIDGPQILGGEDAHLLGDGVHPGPAGYRQMADRLGPRLANLLT